MELELELRLANDGVADRKTLHLEWTAFAGHKRRNRLSLIRHLEPDEVAALVKRGEGFIASGDLASARLVLQRAAEAGEAQAALSLAGTFDPIALDEARPPRPEGGHREGPDLVPTGAGIGIGRGTRTAAVARGPRPMRRANGPHGTGRRTSFAAASVRCRR